MGGVTNSTGILEFCAHGVWGIVCDSHNNWGPGNAQVVCKQLGFSTEGKRICLTHINMLILLSSYLSLDAHILDYQKRFGSSENDAVVGEVHCVGTENELLECSHSSVGNHQCWYFFYDDHPEIIISCYGMLKMHWPLSYYMH